MALVFYLNYMNKRNVLYKRAGATNDQKIALFKNHHNIILIKGIVDFLCFYNCFSFFGIYHTFI